MANAKAIPPYKRLLEEIKKFCYGLAYPTTKTMFVYPKDKLNTESWLIWDLAERVRAADQLGFDVVLRMADDGLNVLYRKRVEIPWQWKP